MTKLQLLAVLLGCILLAAPLSRVSADEDDYEDVELEDEEVDDEPAEPDEKDVVVLTTANFDEKIDAADYALVEFYAPWCGHCKKLKPEYAKAATALKEHDDKIIIAKVDATEEKELGEKFSIQGYPTLKWFVKGKPTEYNGGRDSDSIIKWVKKKTGPPAITLSTTDELEAAQVENEVIIVGYFDEFKGEKFDAFLEAARLSEDVIFAQTTSSKVAAAASIEAGTPAIVAVKHFDGETKDTVALDGDITAENIEDFVLAEKLPLVIPFLDKNQEKIFDSGIEKQVLIIGSEDDVKADSTFLTMVKSVAAKFKGKLLFVSVNASDEASSSPVINFFGLDGATWPKVVAFQLNGSKKFKFTEEEITEDTLNTWASGLVDGSVEPDYKSEDIPEDDMDGNVKVVVGKTVDAIVKDPTRDVLLEVYAPWCGHCKSLEPTYKKLGKRFAKIDSVVIAKMDGTANEHRDIDVQGFPTILFFPAEEGAEAVSFEGGDRSLKALTKFIKTNAKVEYELPKKNASQDDESESDKTEL